MRTIISIIALVALLATTICADTTTVSVPVNPTAHSVKIGFAMQYLMPWNLHTGEGFNYGMAFGFNATTKIAGPVSAGLELGFMTATAGKFQPNPQGSVAISYKVSDGFAVGTAFLYRRLIRFDGMKTAGHFTSIVIVPNRIFDNGWSLSFPSGLIYNSIIHKTGLCTSVKMVVPFGGVF